MTGVQMMKRGTMRPRCSMWPQPTVSGYDVTGAEKVGGVPSDEDGGCFMWPQCTVTFGFPNAALLQNLLLFFHLTTWLASVLSDLIVLKKLAEKTA